MKVIHTDNTPAALGPYSQAYVSNGFLFASGQTGIDPKTGEVGADVVSQADQVCKNLGTILAAGGTDFTHVVKTTCFLADMGDFAVFNEVYARYFTSRPARSCIAVKTLPKNLLCEIELIAEV